MFRKAFCIVVLILCFGLTLTACPKKTVVKEEPAVKATEPGARPGAEQAAKPQEKTAKEFEKSLVAKKEPGIGGPPAYDSKLLKDIHFDFDKYNIRPEDAEILRENAAWLKQYSKGKIQIEGHCDERGTAEYNLALGERRANSTKMYLRSLGIPADLISTISYGKEKPLDPNHMEEAWAKNRRGHFIILGK